MPLSSVLQTIIVLQLFCNSLCQFPMQFPFAPMGSPQQIAPNGMAPMAPMGSMPQLSQPMFPPPMPISFPMQRKMPSVVMPFYSKHANNPENKYRRKRRKHRKHDESWESDNDYSASGSAELNFRRSKTKKRRQVLTPVVSYVTKDGYVVYQKKIKKDKAKEWLEMNKRNKDSEVFTSDEERQFEKMLKYKKKKHQHH